MLFDMLEDGLADYWSHLVSGKEVLFSEQVVQSQVRLVNGEISARPLLDILEASMNFDKFFSANLGNQKLVVQNIH